MTIIAILFTSPFIHILLIREVWGVRRKTTNPTRLATYGIKILGDHSEGVTPVPIPNTEVKPFSADGTAWVTVWESRTLPRLNLKACWEQQAFLFLDFCLIKILQFYLDTDFSVKFFKQ